MKKAQDHYGKQKAAIMRLHEFAADIRATTEDGGGVVLLGPIGTGKDHLLVALARTAIFQHGYEVRWQSGMELYADFRDAINTGEPEREVIKRSTKPDILILSDPQPPRGDLSDYQVSTLFRIIDARYSQRRPTWVSLNVIDGAEAGRRIGEATVDRLRDGAVTIPCDWPSYRKPKTERSE